MADEGFYERDDTFAVRTSLLRILRCPGCGGELTCKAQERDTERIRAGALACAGCGASYPIVDGIPRFVPRENYTASFAYQWDRFRGVQLDRVNGTTLSERRLLRETGHPAEWWPGKRVLDVGCGAGRFMDVAARLGADVVGVDASGAVDAALANLAGERGVDLVQADVYALPFARGTFDLVYCIGVIQHTPHPLAAVAALPPMARPGGEVAVTAYERRRATPLFSKYLARALLAGWSVRSKMTLIARAMPVLFPITDVLFRLPLLGRAFRFVIPVANYVEMRELTRAQRYEWALLDTLDMLGPRYDAPQREREVAVALRGAGADSVRRLPNPGLNLVARRSTQ